MQGNGSQLRYRYGISDRVPYGIVVVCVILNKPNPQ